MSGHSGYEPLEPDKQLDETEAAEYMKRIKQLKGENQQLEAQIASLERAQATGDFSATGSILNLETLFTVSGSTDQISIEDLETVEEDNESDNSDYIGDDDEEDSDILDDIVR